MISRRETLQLAAALAASGAGLGTRPPEARAQTPALILPTRTIRRAFLSIDMDDGDCYMPSLVPGYDVFRVTRLDFGTPREYPPRELETFLPWTTGVDVVQWAVQQLVAEMDAQIPLDALTRS